MKHWLRILLGATLALFAAAQAQAAPSLQLTAVTSGVATAEPGDWVTFTITITNAAAAGVANDLTVPSTGDFTLTMSSNTASSINLAPLVGVAIPPITAGASVDVQVTRQIPVSTSQAAAYYVNATVANVAPAVAVSVASFTTDAPILTVVGTPDFRITSLTYPAGTAYVGGNIIPMSLTWTNLISSSGSNNVPYVSGQNSSATFFRIDVILSSNPTFGDTDDFLLTSHDIGGTENADGLDRLITWNQLLPGNFSGTYYVMARVDALNGVPETIDNDLTINGNNTWFAETNATRITLSPTNFPTIYWAGPGSNGFSDTPSISADGRFTAFASDATNLISGAVTDTNNARDIFVYDNQNITVRRLSVSQQGVQSNASSNSPAISGNGRYVAFSSDATNLILPSQVLPSGDVNGFSDIFIVDTVTGGISIQSLSTAGVQSNGSSFRPSVSHTGRYVVFESSATNLAGTAVGVTQIYLRNRDVSGSGIFDTPGNVSTELISRASGVSGGVGNGNSVQATISADGQFVAFASDATNLIATDAGGFRDVFLRDRVTNTTILVSRTSGGVQGDGASRAPSLNRNPGVTTGISADGRYVAYGSEATNLVAGDTNAVSDIFVFDRLSLTTTRVSVSSAGAQAVDPSAAGFRLGSINPSISSTGRYVAFASLANNLTAGDSGGKAQATDANGAVDVFVIDREVSGAGSVYDAAGNIATTMVSVNRFGYQTQGLLGTPSTAASDIYPVISADGRWVALPSDAENTAGLVHGPTNRTSPDLNTFRDIFVHDRRINTLPGPGTPPTVVLTNPAQGSSATVNTQVTVTATASATVGVIANVDFFVNGTLLGSGTTFPYSATWTPTALGTYTLSALTTDTFGNQAVSSNVVVTVGPSSPPTVSITNPPSGTSVVTGSVVSLSAAAADSDGTVTQVRFLANGNIAATAAAAPFVGSWSPSVAGTYTVVAQASDNSGNVTNSSPITVTVVSNTAPTVSLTSPANGTAVRIGTAASLSATAADTDGTIASVQFFANGQVIGAPDTTPPYTGQWLPVAEGIYRLTATALDDSGSAATSSTTTVVVVSGTAGDRTFAGSFFGLNETGRFALLVSGQTGVFTGYSTAGGTKVHHYSGFELDSAGGFSQTDATGKVLIAGSASETGMTITMLDGVPTILVGIAQSGLPSAVQTGLYSGNLSGRPQSKLSAIVGADRSITIVITDGAATSVGAGVVGTTGNFTNIATTSGGVVSGRIDPATGFLTGSLSGTNGGSFTGGLASGVSFSDGFLKNLSTRGLVGSGADVLTAGFYVGGSTPKQVLIRAIGPSLAAYGITSPLANPQLSIYNSQSNVIYSNDNWAGAPALVSASGSVGAFALSSSSLDAVVLATLAPGSYTAQVAGVGGSTGIGLVEIYDVDSLAPFSPQKVINLSTRGQVGPGQGVLSAGFMVNGNTSKKVLIRAAGPGLGAVAPSLAAGVLADPMLQLVRIMPDGSQVLVRENDSWEVGNDSTLVAGAAASVGAFPFATGSRDASILITIPPGIYVALVTGPGTATGLALVEVYEVP